MRPEHAFRFTGYEEIVFLIKKFIEILEALAEGNLARICMKF
jgi:hypothetical protein